MDSRTDSRKGRVTKYVIDIKNLEHMYRATAPSVLSQHMEFKAYVDICIVNPNIPSYDDAILETLFIEMSERSPNEEVIYPYAETIELFTSIFCEDFDRHIDNTLAMYNIKYDEYNIERWLDSHCVLVGVKELRY